MMSSFSCRVQFGREASGFELLTHHLAASFGRQMIRAYRGEKIGLWEIRKSMSCGMLKAVSYRNQAYDTLDAIHAQAMDRLGLGFYVDEAHRRRDSAGPRPVHDACGSYARDANMLAPVPDE